MTTIQAFFLGMMVVLTPSMLLLALLLCREGTLDSRQHPFRGADDALFGTDLID